VAQDQAQLLATDLRKRIEDRALRSQADAWAAADSGQRKKIQSELSGVTAQRLHAALSTPEPVWTDAPVGDAMGWTRNDMGFGARFQLRVPANYDPARKWPVHVSLHGGGGNPARSCMVNWQGEPAEEGVILVCPKTPKGMWWMPRGESTVRSVLAEVRRRYNVDTDRVSIGGASSGGFGVWHNASKYPWVWRAAVPRCAATPKDPETLQNLASLPTFLLHGRRDGRISVRNSRTSHALLSKLGGDTTYAEEPGFGHSFMRPRNLDVLNWIGGKEREVAHEFEYHTVLRGTAPARVHWLAPDWGTTYEPGLELNGQIVRETRGQGTRYEIRVDGTADLDAFTLLFPQSDELDPTDPVTVYYGDKAVFSGRLRPSRDAVLASWAGHRDPRLLSLFGTVVDLH
jgi:acetyl esterase/lipase